MPNPLKLASLWRVIKDLDLEGVRVGRARAVHACNRRPMRTTTRRGCGNC